jgi:hypothetical protein
MTRSASQIPWVSYTRTSLGDSSVLLSGLLHDLVASGAATWRDRDGMVGGDRTVVVEVGEGLAAVMKDCDCWGLGLFEMGFHVKEEKISSGDGGR